jgi:hypothetical protein
MESGRVCSLLNWKSLADFDAEISFLQRTRSPYLVRFFGAGQLPDNTTPFLVLELMELGSLDTFLTQRAGGDVSWECRVSINCARRCSWDGHSQHAAQTASILKEWQRVVYRLLRCSACQDRRLWLLIFGNSTEHGAAQDWISLAHERNRCKPPRTKR